MLRLFSTIIVIVFILHPGRAETGYELWLRYPKMAPSDYRNQAVGLLNTVTLSGSSPTIEKIRKEIEIAANSALEIKPRFLGHQDPAACLLIQRLNDEIIKTFFSPKTKDSIGNEGFVIKQTGTLEKPKMIIAANTDIGLLYGTFHLLRLLNSRQDLNDYYFLSAPSHALRMLNHWDNLNRSVERGYAGISIWNWHTLPDFQDNRYHDYARANASIGINGTVLTNVNADALILTEPYLEKTAALANIFRPYGIKTYLTARFSAPIEIGGLKTADPLDPAVKKWWAGKINDIYSKIPDFGGFLVKANSEGQPGPQNYQRTHADGANMLAEALMPFNGIVMWRAFVYEENAKDRFKQAFNEFKPLDGKFHKNVIIQVKNGPIDFQPREPFSPLFGAMPESPLMMEFQLTQEYLGQATHLVYEAPMFEEVLRADTYANGKGSTVAKVVDGSLQGFALNGMAGVANIGNDINWTGHPFGQANWYALGRLAWNHQLSSAEIAEEWIRQTFSNEERIVDRLKTMMMSSHQILVNYMTPLGLHHIMANGHHYGPAPWSNNLPREDWNPVYYHKADESGIGFDRTETGSNALSQYHPEVRKQWKDLNTCDENYLLWFHHVPWQKKMKSGRTLWEELCFKYQEGVEGVRDMQKTWNDLSGTIDAERFEAIKMLLTIQEKESVWWKNACLLYFQTYAKMPLPSFVEKPDQTLDYYKGLHFPFAPGNGK